MKVAKDGFFSGPIKFNTAKLSTDFTMVSQFSCSFRRKKKQKQKGIFGDVGGRSFHEMVLRIRLRY